MQEVPQVSENSIMTHGLTYTIHSDVEQMKVVWSEIDSNCLHSIQRFVLWRRKAWNSRPACRRRCSSLPLLNVLSQYQINQLAPKTRKFKPQRTSSASVCVVYRFIVRLTRAGWLAGWRHTINVRIFWELTAGDRGVDRLEHSSDDVGWASAEHLDHALIC